MDFRLFRQVRNILKNTSSNTAIEYTWLSKKIRYRTVDQREFEELRQAEFSKDDDMKLETMLQKSGLKVLRNAQLARDKIELKQVQFRAKPLYFIIQVMTSNHHEVRNDLDIARTITNFLIDVEASVYPHSIEYPFEIIVYHNSQQYSDIYYMSGQFKLFKSMNKLRDQADDQQLNLSNETMGSKDQDTTFGNKFQDNLTSEHAQYSEDEQLQSCIKNFTMIHRRNDHNIRDKTIKLLACHIKNCKFIGRINILEYKFETARSTSTSSKIINLRPNNLQEKFCDLHLQLKGPLNENAQDFFNQTSVPKRNIFRETKHLRRHFITFTDQHFSQVNQGYRLIAHMDKQKAMLERFEHRSAKGRFGQKNWQLLDSGLFNEGGHFITFTDGQVMQLKYNQP